MIDKAPAGYMHVPRGDYDCDDCPMWIEMSRRCVLHGASDIVLDSDSCNYFVLGFAGQFGQTPLGYLTKEQSGFCHSVAGLSCKRCKHWLRDEWACEGVNKDSAGDDPGMIHPDGCCDLWEIDPTFGHLPSEALIAIQK
jgi:hypothetical protein